MALGGAIACSNSDTATLRVDLRTDLVRPLEFDAITIRVDGEGLSTEGAPMGDYRSGVRVAELDGVPVGGRDVTVVLQSGGGTVATRTVRTDVQQPSTTVVVLIAASCAERVCPGPGDPAEATECDLEGCVVPEGTDAGVSDAGSPGDAAAPPDLGSDAGVALVCPAEVCQATTCGAGATCQNEACTCSAGYRGTTCNQCLDDWVRLGDGSCAPSSVLIGTEGRDDLVGRLFAIHLVGLAGNDDLMGSSMGDRLEGGDGDDQLDGREGGDLLFGGDGVDELQGGAGSDTLVGGEGNDRLRGGDHADTLIGGLGDDELDGNRGDDRYVLDGLGADVISDNDGDADTAYCAAGVYVVAEEMRFSDRILELSTGGTVTIERDEVETIVCCRL
ncbi:MAG: hypothetical protein CMN30_17765 [Sandaracinus sp.]|nr:hypothetical protein [Sandaracinus sp.]